MMRVGDGVRETRFVIGPVTRPVTFRLQIDRRHGLALVVDENLAVVESLPLDPDSTAVIPMPARPRERAVEPIRPVGPPPALHAVYEPATGSVTVHRADVADLRARECAGMVVLLPIHADYRPRPQAPAPLSPRIQSGWFAGSRQGDPRMDDAWDVAR